MLRIQLVEDDPDFVYLLESMISKETDMEVVSCGCSRENCVADALKYSPDIVLLDLMLSEGKDTALAGVEIAREIRLKTRAKILILTSLEKPGIVLEASTRAFASGYLFKSNYGQIPEMIRSVLKGNGAEEIMICAAVIHKLTVSEYYVLLDYLGYQAELHSSPKTIANQRSSIVRKLGLGKPEDMKAIFSNYPKLTELFHYT